MGRSTQSTADSDRQKRRTLHMLYAVCINVQAPVSRSPAYTTSFGVVPIGAFSAALAQSCAAVATRLHRCVSLVATSRTCETAAPTTTRAHADASTANAHAHCVHSAHMHNGDLSCNMRVANLSGYS